MKRVFVVAMFLLSLFMRSNAIADAEISISTGFILPVNWSSVSECGVWQGRPSPNGCYDFGDVYHTGIDLMANEGVKVRAIADGVISYISKNGWNSPNDTRNVGVIIEHRMMSGKTFRVIYGHIRNVTREQGETVKSGEVFAEVGDWYGTKDHLHLGVLATGLEFPINPTHLGRWPDQLFGTDLSVDGKNTGYNDNGLIDPNEFSVSEFPDNWLSRAEVPEASLQYPIRRTNPWFYQYCVINRQDSRCDWDDVYSFMECQSERQQWCFIGKGIGGKGSGGDFGVVPATTVNLTASSAASAAAGPSINSGTVYPGQQIKFEFRPKASGGKVMNFLGHGEESVDAQMRFRIGSGKWQVFHTNQFTASKFDTDSNRTLQETAFLMVPNRPGERLCIQGEIDTGKDVKESNEGDNFSPERCYQVSTQSLDTDLVADDTWVTPNPVPANGDLRAVMILRNVGSEQPLTNESRAQYAISGPCTNYAWTEIATDGMNASDLAPGRQHREEILSAVRAPAVPGMYQLRACADANDKIFETDEYNNCLYVWFEVRDAKPDFVITRIGLREGSSVKKDTRIHPYFTVCNVGDARPSLGIRSDYRIDGDRRTDDGTDAGQLNPGQCQDESVQNNDIKMGNTGTRTLTVCADWKSQVPESNENNNCASFSYTVKK